MFKSPIKNHVSFDRFEGNYDFLHPNDKSAQYVFYLPHLNRDEIKEKGLTQSFLVSLEKDYDFSPESYTPLECLYEILRIYEGYWIHSGKGEVQKLIDYLESIEEEQAKKRLQYSLDYAIAERDYWTKQVEILEEEVSESIQ